MSGKKEKGASGEELAQKAGEISAPLPIETQALETGVGRLGEAAGLALEPSTFLSRLQPAVEALTQGAGREVFETLAPQFQRRGITTSGLFPEAGSRALVQQALGVSRLVLGAAPQFLGAGIQAGGQLAGIGSAARGRQISGGLTGLGLQSQTEQAAMQRQAATQQALGAGIGGLAGTLGAAALTPTLGPASSLLQQQNLLNLTGNAINPPGFNLLPRPTGR